VYYPRASLFYHPRNKNLGIGSLIEALLYEAQRFRTTDFESLKYLEDVADHCTICHKCLDPCPVKIDTGEVSILEREILVARGTKQTALATRLTLAYLDSTNRTFNALFRLLVLRLGTAAQRLGRGSWARSGCPTSWRGAGRWPCSARRCGRRRDGHCTAPCPCTSRARRS
jgi:D-lactate dehydrogenase (cytochrome)